MPRETPKSLAKMLSTKQMAQCVLDAVNWQDKGTLEQGALSAFADQIQLHLDCDDTVALQHAEAAVLREAALRYVAAKTTELPAGWMA